MTSFFKSKMIANTFVTVFMMVSLSPLSHADPDTADGEVSVTQLSEYRNFELITNLHGRRVVYGYRGASGEYALQLPPGTIVAYRGEKRPLGLRKGEPIENLPAFERVWWTKIGDDSYFFADPKKSPMIPKDLSAKSNEVFLFPVDNPFVNKNGFAVDFTREERAQIYFNSVEARAESIRKFTKERIDLGHKALAIGANDTDLFLRLSHDQRVQDLLESSDPYAKYQFEKFLERMEYANQRGWLKKGKVSGREMADSMTKLFMDFNLPVLRLINVALSDGLSDAQLKSSVVDSFERSARRRNRPIDKAWADFKAMLTKGLKEGVYQEIQSDPTGLAYFLALEFIDSRVDSQLGQIVLNRNILSVSRFLDLRASQGLMRHSKELREFVRKSVVPTLGILNSGWTIRDFSFQDLSAPLGGTSQWILIYGEDKNSQIELVSQNMFTLGSPGFISQMNAPAKIVKISDESSECWGRLVRGGY